MENAIERIIRIMNGEDSVYPKIKLSPAKPFDFRRSSSNQNRKRKKNMLNVSRSAKRKHKRN